MTLQREAANGTGNTSTVFREVQYFRSLPLMIVIMAAMAGVVILLLCQVPILRQKNGPVAPVLIPAVIMSLVFLLFIFMRLEVEVHTLSFRYRFFPFLPRWREFELVSVESAEAVSYRPIMEFGGWGIRYGRGMWAYTVSGNRGVIIRMRDGKTFILGTGKPGELQRSLSGGA